MEDLSNYEKLRGDAHNFYNNIGNIYCQFLNQSVQFNAEGFNHIIFKRARSEREKSSQILRFKLLPLAAKLVKISTTYQEFEETIKEFKIKKFKNKSNRSCPVRYWGVIAIIDGQKIKVIIRKIGDNGSPHFWSVVPAWVTNNYRDTKFYTTMKGDPEED